MEFLSSGTRAAFFPFCALKERLLSWGGVPSSYPAQDPPCIGHATDGVVLGVSTHRLAGVDHKPQVQCSRVKMGRQL